MTPRGPVRVVICGPPGAGKTGLARAASNAVTRVGKGALGAHYYSSTGEPHGDQGEQRAWNTAPPATIPPRLAGPDDDADRATLLLDTPGWASSIGADDNRGGVAGTSSSSSSSSRQHHHLASLVPHLRGVARDADVVVLAYDAGGTPEEVADHIDALAKLWLPALREALQRPRRRAGLRSIEKEEDGSELMVDDDWRRVPVVVAGCRRDARQAHEGHRAGQSNGAAGMNGNGHGNGQSSAAAEVKTAETKKLGDETDSTANDGGSSSGDALLALMETWREVESCVECSARTGFNVLKTIALARRASLYPAAPLTKNVPGTKVTLPLGSNSVSGSTTTTHGLQWYSRRCVEALSGVFATHDVDGDGVLTDADVARVQRQSFRVPLAPGELDGLKAVCANGLDGGVIADLDGNGGSGLTLSGFLYAHGLFVRRGRAETTWTVLRAHGYDDDLEPTEADDEAEREETAEGEAGRSVEGIAAGRVDLNGPFAVSKKVDVVAYLAAGAVLAGAALLAFRMTSGRDGGRYYSY
jgi:Ras family protein T1